jgi:fatty acid/phospholipid biosynthesis enzyme
VIIAHGSSKSQAIKQAIIFAHQTVDQKVLPSFNKSLQALLEKSSTVVQVLKDSSSAHQAQL